MRVLDVVLAVALVVLAVWCFALDRTLAKILRRQELDEARRLRRAGL